MAATIRDVARLAGVSPSTVSRTCTNHASISNQTKEKVRAAMSELGYRPNFQASSLANRSSKTIGIVLPVSEAEVYQNSFYLEIIRGIGKLCNQRQYMITLVTGETDNELWQAIYTMSKSGQAEGFILLYSKQQDVVLERLYENGLLYALIGKPYQNLNHTIYVDNDNIQAAKEATDHLISLGHRNIAFLGNDSRNIFVQDRKSGYTLSMLEHGLPCLEAYYIEESVISEEKDKHIRNLLTMTPPPTAIVASDDILSMALEKTASGIGIEIPRQLSVISFNNSLFARLTAPQLTSIEVNPYQLGIEAASQIINHVEDPTLPATKTIVPHRIIERESCAVLPMEE